MTTVIKPLTPVEPMNSIQQLWACMARLTPERHAIITEEYGKARAERLTDGQASKRVLGMLTESERAILKKFC